MLGIILARQTGYQGTPSSDGSCVEMISPNSKWVRFIAQPLMVGVKCLYNVDMKYEWSEEKNLVNLEKHRIDFAAIESFEWGTAIVEPANRHGEIRWVAIGLIGNRLYHVVFTDRGGSNANHKLRKASRRESRRYFETEREIIIPTDEEEADIQRGSPLNPDAPEWTDEDWARARPATEVVPHIVRNIGVHVASRSRLRRFLSVYGLMRTSWPISVRAERVGRLGLTKHCAK